MSSGSSASGTTRYEWNPEMQARWPQLMNWAGDLADNNRVPFTRSTRFSDGSISAPGQRVAGLNRGQRDAADNAYNLMQGAKSPLGSMDASSQFIQDSLGGKYLDPSGGTLRGNDPFNPWTHEFRNKSAEAKNEFGGMSSPYFRSVVNQGLDDMTGAYQRGTSADTTRMFNLSGAFGGSAHQNAVANNESALAKQMGNYISGMQNQQYDRSAGLEEGRLGRMTGAEEGLLSRGNEGWQRAADRQFQGRENQLGRMGQLVGAAQNEQGMAIDRGNWASQMGGLLQGQQQRELDSEYGDFTDEQNYPFKMIQFLSDMYGRAMGGGAGLQTSVYGGGPSRGQQAGAGLLALAGLLG